MGVESCVVVQFNFVFLIFLKVIVLVRIIGVVIFGNVYEGFVGGVEFKVLGQYLFVFIVLREVYCF